jgi:hypothetical protein
MEELNTKLHEAVDLVEKAAEMGLDAEVTLKLPNGLELDISKSADTGYAIFGRYTPEGGLHGEH